MCFLKWSAAVLLSSLTLSGAQADSGLMTRFEEMKWIPIEGTPMELTILWGDRETGPYVMYLKMPA